MAAGLLALLVLLLVKGAAAQELGEDSPGISGASATSEAEEGASTVHAATTTGAADTAAFCAFDIGCDLRGCFASLCSNLCASLLVATAILATRRLPRMQMQEGPKLRTSVLDLFIGRLVMNPAVEQGCDGLRDAEEHGLEHSHKGHEERCDVHLPRPCEDCRRQNLATDKHHRHRDEHCRPGGHELVKEDGHRLVSHCVEEQQRHEKHVVVTHHLKQALSVYLVPAQLLPRLYVGSVVLGAGGQDQGEAEGLQRRQAQREARCHGRTADTEADGPHEDPESKRLHLCILGLAGWAHADGPLQPMALCRAGDRDLGQGRVPDEGVRRATQGVVAPKERAPGPSTQLVMHLPAVAGHARLPVVEKAVCALAPVGCPRSLIELNHPAGHGRRGGVAPVLLLRLLTLELGEVAVEVYADPVCATSVPAADLSVCVLVTAHNLAIRALVARVTLLTVAVVAVYTVDAHTKSAASVPQLDAIVDVLT
mmetsp:Transcript_38650/g.82199  ORF Transcript_38650/g.82199 Transcript_38650/m.82199 type:complete len:482 (+) Transcript_38650:379-1824(+)